MKAPGCAPSSWRWRRATRPQLHRCRREDGGGVLRPKARSPDTVADVEMASSRILANVAVEMEMAPAAYGPPAGSLGVIAEAEKVVGLLAGILANVSVRMEMAPTAHRQPRDRRCRCGDAAGRTARPQLLDIALQSALPPP